MRGVGPPMSGKLNVSKALAEEVVRSFGEVRLRVFGTSMVPSILPGDLISIQRANLNEISLGEIILFAQDGRLFVHRVVSRVRGLDTSCLITRGDRLGHDDPAVLPSHFLGRVTCIERGHQQFEPASLAKGWKRLILRVLRCSDLATYAYLRLAAHWRTRFPRRAECQL